MKMSVAQLQRRNTCHNTTSTPKSYSYFHITCNLERKIIDFNRKDIKTKTYVFPWFNIQKLLQKDKTIPVQKNFGTAPL